ncbi:DNA repair protein RecN [Galenea microaerophila]
MLKHLHIKNLALIEELQLPFANGFTALTGETGAGKSILLDALGLTLGNRADASLVRHGAKKADITAEYDLKQLPQVQAWLEENDLENDEPEQCLMRRTVTAEGRSKAYINGIAVPVAQLKTLAAQLIDIHGQHEHQSLMKPAQQLKLVDAYGGLQAEQQQVSQLFKQWQTLKQQYQTQLDVQSDQQSRLALLQFQLEEFAKVAPQENEFTELSEEQNTLSHASEILTASQTAYTALEGDEHNSTESATAQVLNAIEALEQIADYQPALQTQIEQLNQALIELQETASDIHHFSQNIELDPQRLEQVEARLAELHGLAKKYLISPEELIQKQQKIEAELKAIEHADASLEQLQQAVSEAEEAYLQAALKLSQQRQTAAQQLAEQVTLSMQTLGMENGQFAIEFQPLEASAASGLDKVTFQVTANKGQPLQPLTKVASGGELSRISLSIQVATAEVASLPTLIFDEVDVGIGGGIAEVVGQKMQQLGQQRQILSITHLAQVAAHGHQHYRVSKNSDAQQTTTQVQKLSKPERIDELARMLGGLKITPQTRKHAQEMLELAQKSV